MRESGSTTLAGCLGRPNTFPDVDHPGPLVLDFQVIYIYYVYSQFVNIYIFQIGVLGRLWNYIYVHETHKITTIHKQTLHQKFYISHFICISSNFVGVSRFFNSQSVKLLRVKHTQVVASESHVKAKMQRPDLPKGGLNQQSIFSPTTDWWKLQNSSTFPWMSRDWWIIRGGIKHNVENKMYSFDKIEGAAVRNPAKSCFC